MDALADVGSVPSWSHVHQRVEVIDAYYDGRPHHVKVTMKVLGLMDTEVLEYRWGRHWLVCGGRRTFRQHAQHVEYNLRPEAGKTRVRFDVTVELWAMVPDFLMRRAQETVLEVATEGLRKRVTG